MHVNEKSHIEKASFIEITDPTLNKTLPFGRLIQNKVVETFYMYYTALVVQ